MVCSHLYNSPRFDLPVGHILRRESRQQSDTNATDAAGESRIELRTVGIPVFMGGGVRMNLEQKERALQQHRDKERNSLPHPDGCFYCGGQHPTDCCQSPDRDEFWAIGDGPEAA